MADDGCCDADGGFTGVPLFCSRREPFSGCHKQKSPSGCILKGSFHKHKDVFPTSPEIAMRDSIKTKVFEGKGWGLGRGRRNFLQKVS
ncbi:hypothetical protein, partial [Bilophila wadsworthia]|uniref:hypothetical protein n=1 Tax=Bilophila wadsworthia TaxID=35833 RepID=UPI00307B4DE9